MPTHLVFESVAARIDRGEYSPCVAARIPVAPPSAPTAASFAPWWTYAASALMGAVIGLLLAS